MVGDEDTCSEVDATKLCTPRSLTLKGGDAVVTKDKEVSNEKSDESKKEKVFFCFG